MQEAAIAAIDIILKELSEIEGAFLNGNNREMVYEKLKRWKNRSVDKIRNTVSADEGDKFADKYLMTYSMNDPFGNFRNEVSLYQSHLKVLKEEIKEHGEYILKQPLSVVNPLVSSEKILSIRSKK